MRTKLPTLIFALLFAILMVSGITLTAAGSSGAMTDRQQQDLPTTPTPSPIAQQVATQLGVEAAVVQQILDQGVSPEQIDLAMVLEQMGEPIEPLNIPNDPSLVTSASADATIVRLESCSSQIFPFVRVGINVLDNGAPHIGLTSANFSCTENGFAQADNFSITPPNTGNNVRIADVVFLIDSSSSMSGEIAAVRTNATAFARALAASGIDYRLESVRYFVR